MKKGIITVVIAVTLIGGGLAIMSLNKSSSTTDGASPQTSASSETTTQTGASTITYSDKGFSPSNITVKAGDLVSVTNNSSSSLQFASDPHPQHTDNKDLNVGVIKKGQSMTFRASKIGTFGFHNHYQAGDTGMITVQ